MAAAPATLSSNAMMVMAFGGSEVCRANGVNHRSSLARQGCIGAIVVASVDDHLIAGVGELVETRDVVIAESHAAVGDGLAEFGGLLGSMDGVSVAEVEPVA